MTLPSCLLYHLFVCATFTSRLRRYFQQRIILNLSSKYNFYYRTAFVQKCLCPGKLGNFRTAFVQKCLCPGKLGNSRICCCIPEIRVYPQNLGFFRFVSVFGLTQTLFLLYLVSYQDRLRNSK